uniref:Uncharacterized protein n=1 Tax=Lepeophtheirus salmonis TaxID=72036 RepID=A0A0K2UJ49_LEPSM
MNSKLVTATRMKALLGVNIVMYTFIGFFIQDLSIHAKDILAGEESNPRQLFHASERLGASNFNQLS